MQITEKNEVQFVENKEASIPNADKGATVEIEGIQVPAKFIGKDGQVNIKGLVQSYTHLEKRNSGAKEVPVVADNATVEPTPTDTPNNTQSETVEEAIPANPNAAFTIEEANGWGQEYASTGKLSDKAYKTLEGRGISREIVDIYIEGIKAKTQLEMNESYKIIGGEAEYKKMIQWASNNLSDQDKTVFNDGVKDSKAREYHIKNMYSRYKGSNPTFISGNNVSESVYANKNEFFDAIKDPRYQTDAAYRNTIMAKLQRSKITV